MPDRLRRTEIAEGICALRPVTQGEIWLHDQVLRLRRYSDAAKAGVVYLSEDRKGSGVFLDLSIAQNIAALDLKALTSLGLLNSRKERVLAEDLTRRLGVRMGGVDMPVSSLSGGNQQKVAIAKQLAVDPKVILMDEPTRGIDVGAKSEIHRLLRELAHAGIGILVISSELPELIGLCDRVLGGARGTISGEVSGDGNDRRGDHAACVRHRVGKRNQLEGIRACCLKKRETGTMAVDTLRSQEKREGRHEADRHDARGRTDCDHPSLSVIMSFAAAFPDAAISGNLMSFSVEAIVVAA